MTVESRVESPESSAKNATLAEVLAAVPGTGWGQRKESRKKSHAKVAKDAKEKRGRH